VGGGSLGVAILPRRHRVGLAPESPLLLPGFSLGLPIARLDVGAGIPDILLVYPGKAVANLIEIGIDAIDINDGQRATVAVQAVSFQLNLAAEYQLTQVLLGTLAERL
jgi:hypothetical protein